MQPEWILASDIDNTLTGDPPALSQLAERLQAEREAGQLFLILSTGRRLNQVMDGFQHEGIPQADAIISQVGTEIYLPPYSPEMSPLTAWDEMLREQFSRDIALTFLTDIEGLVLQPDKYNTPLKVSCYLDETPDPDAAAALIQKRVTESGQDDVYQVVWSSGRDLDIIPAAAGKGKAIHFLLAHLDLHPEKIIVAGDSGNDRSMFDEHQYGIVVGNAKPELMQLREEADDDIYFAQKRYAAGVIEGLEKLNVFN